MRRATDGAHVLRITLVSLLSLVASTAYANDVAPALDQLALRSEANVALQSVAGLRKQTPLGLYAAFDADRVHPYVLPACDDDGDPVVVISDAALTLLEWASYARALDDRDGSHLLDDYARTLTRSQRAGAPLLPPGESFFLRMDASIEPRATDYLREGLRFWLGFATAAHDAPEFRCAAPDTLRERGDAVWTEAERSAALLRAKNLQTARIPLRTTWALAGSFALGANTPERIGGALAQLTAAHPWQSPFPLPDAATLEASANALRELAKTASTPPPVAKPVPTAKRRRR